jgi:hypothetical protein
MLGLCALEATISSKLHLKILVRVTNICLMLRLHIAYV